MPLTMEMNSLNATFKSTLKEYVPLKMSLTLSIVVFIVNLFLHRLFMWAYHKFKIVRVILSFFRSPHCDMKPCYIITILNCDNSYEIDQKIELCKDVEKQLAIYIQTGKQLIPFKEVLHLMGKETPSRSQSKYSLNLTKNTTDVHVSSNDITDPANSTV